MSEDGRGNEAALVYEAAPVYEVALGRLSQVTNGYGTSFAKTSTIAYNDHANTVTVTDAEAPRIPGAIGSESVTRYEPVNCFSTPNCLFLNASPGPRARGLRVAVRFVAPQHVPGDRDQLTRRVHDEQPAGVAGEIVAHGLDLLLDGGAAGAAPQGCAAHSFDRW
ncbi:MAG: hypothetical protein IT169_10420 [Bryobacterales bacterium]|nr:hypothetical protein [Bryobacterales bacterium]